MHITSIILYALLGFEGIDVGMASVFNDKILACPKSTYKHTGLPICANRELPCGTILNVERTDIPAKKAQCVVADRGPFGVCVPSHKNTRACGVGSVWFNGRNIFKRKKPMNLARWRGILDMGIVLAKKLGVKNRLVPVLIYTEIANNISLTYDADDPKVARTKQLGPVNINETRINKNKENNSTMAQHIKN